MRADVDIMDDDHFISYIIKVFINRGIQYTGYKEKDNSYIADMVENALENKIPKNKIYWAAATKYTFGSFREKLDELKNKYRSL